ncbi:MAG: hypothetical protein M1434_13170 [Chloroflexi bacterium]|nr:hypothetical protein [Chloroflexota bacterium]MCL5275673.1 hypothetical protein [Chloroflexota bacterium]
MNTETRETVYMGINFVFTPRPILSKQSQVRFQGALLEAGIEFTKGEFPNENEMLIIRDGPSPLHIRVAVMQPAFGQLMVIMPSAGSTIEMFVKETEAVIMAYGQTWPPPKQVLNSDATFRDLFEATQDHAFQELWEKRLGQQQETLNILGRKVLGGGLRLVMPPQPDDPVPTQIELKIESFLQDSHKFFVETSFTWPQPMQPGIDLDPKVKLKQLDEYIENNVLNFALGG